MATLEFLATDANDQGNFPGWEIVSAFFWCDFKKYYVFLYISYILLLVQTFLFRFKFLKGEKLITLGVGLHQNEGAAPTCTRALPYWVGYCITANFFFQFFKKHFWNKI